MEVSVSGVEWSGDLPVGSEFRARVGRVVKPALLVVTVLAAVTIGGKQLPMLYASQPWQDDPCDVLVSFDLLVLPLLLALAGMRLVLCRASRPVPIRRVLDLLRATVAALTVSLATVAMEWAQTVTGQQRAAWDAATWLQVAVLVVLSVLTTSVWLRVRRLSIEAERAGPTPSQPDWVSDSCQLARLGLDRFTPRLAWPRTVLAWIQDIPGDAMRRHPAGSAGIIAVGLSAPFVAAKEFVEHYPPPLVAVTAALTIATLFALTLGLGTYLRILGTPSAPLPPAALLLASASAGGTGGFAMHDFVLTHQTLAGLALLFGIGAALGATTATIALHSRPPTRRQD